MSEFTADDGGDETLFIGRCQRHAFGVKGSALLRRARRDGIDAMEEVRKFVLNNKIAKKGDKVVVVAGAPLNTHGIETNMMLVETV